MVKSYAADGDDCIMASIYNRTIAIKIHEMLIEAASIKMDNEDFKEAESILHDANELEDAMKKTFKEEITESQIG